MYKVTCAMVESAVERRYRRNGKPVTLKKVAQAVRCSPTTARKRLDESKAVTKVSVTIREYYALARRIEVDAWIPSQAAGPKDRSEPSISQG